MIRAFVAVEIDHAIIQGIVATTAELRQKISGVRWTPQTHSHLTLKFLGNVDAGQIEAIGQVLERELYLFPRFTINAKGLGVFPDASRPRVLWVGVEGKPLAELAERVEKALASLGFAQETRKFTPHLTIGRWRQFKRSDNNLTAALAKWQERDFGGSTVHEVVLFQSILNSSGAEYRRLKATRLGDP
jgi:RNA 2',3'-cyclic 3'-phosphodiesterase